MPECIVVGGGVIGMLTARELFKAGVDVLLLEQGKLGGESSWAGGGIISPLYPWRYHSSVNYLAQRSKALYPSLVRQLKEESGVDCELVKSGMIITDKEEFTRAIPWAKEWNVVIEKISNGSQIKEIEPVINNAIDECLWMPEIMQIRNPNVVRALQLSFDLLNINYQQDSCVVDVVIKDGRVTGVQCEDSFYGADKVIVASGAWSAKLVSKIQTVDIEPVKGQMVMYETEPGMIQRMILADGHYVIPRLDGKVLVGSTLEKTGFDKATSHQAQLELEQAAHGLVPRLSECPVVRHWAGLRPGTQKGIPYICVFDDIEGLYIHAGHYRNGIVLGPASTQLMVELVLARPPSWDPTPYQVSARH